MQFRVKFKRVRRETGLLFFGALTVLKPYPDASSASSLARCAARIPTGNTEIRGGVHTVHEVLVRCRARRNFSLCKYNKLNLQSSSGKAPSASLIMRYGQYLFRFNRVSSVGPITYCSFMCTVCYISMFNCRLQQVIST